MLLRSQSEPDPEDPGALTVEEASDTILGTIAEIWEAFLGHLPLIVAGVLVLFATFLVAAVARLVARRALKRVSLRGSLKELIERLVLLLVWILGLLLAAMVVFPGVDPADALAALGIGSIAIGLAFKDIFENLFAGVLILWRFPFENGDFITCNGYTGKVLNTTVRSTQIRTVEGELVVIPNATIYKNPVEVLTHRSIRRITVIAGVAYGEDVGQSRSVIRAAVEGCKTVDRSEPIEIFAQEFADSGINFEVTWWTGATPLQQRQSRDEVVEAVKKGLDDAGIEIPFPYRTLTFKEPLTTRRGDGEPD